MIKSETNKAIIARLAERYSSIELGERETIVRKIISEVKAQGDTALMKYNQEFDNYSGSLKQEPSKVKIDNKLEAAIIEAKSRIEKFHLEEMRATRLNKNWSFIGELGENLGVNYQPLDSVGIYIPGGQAPLLSTVLMTAIPARIAGVRRIVMASPPNRDGGIHPVILAAARIANIDEIYAVGGAQAIAALAYGTETISPVDKIVGPGNIFVSIAKKEVFGKVGIDGIYGPSELAIVADDSAKPEEVAADVLSQLEHGSGLESTLVISFSTKQQAAIITAVETAINNLSKHKNDKQIQTIRTSFSKWSAVLVAENLEEAVELINLYAPEHLELQLENARDFSTKIKNAGAIFIGSNSCESLGDYLAGPSHCLPTAGSARFSSGLQCADFIKRSSVIDFSTTKRGSSSFKHLIETASTLARAEELEGHALAAEQRLTSEAQQSTKPNA